MISGHDTTCDWQKHTGQIAILPVGAFEQHSAHLPLETDIIGAQYFARRLSEDLDAALLPVLPFGSSLEHTGFRGSISLRPESLMHLVRDIAAELEAQNFKVLVLVNGHGGNFSLAPAAREWNRADRTLKILLLNWWEFCDASLMQSTSLDVHAGDFETSVLLAIAPEIVRRDLIETPRTESASPANGAERDVAIPLRQSDLNLFGMGYFSRTGAIGDAEQATPEKGRALVNSACKNMAAFARERIGRLQSQLKYSGSGGLAIRAFTEGDLDAAMRLKEIAGWNQTEADWRRFLQSNPAGCLVAVKNGFVVGTAATIRYEGKIAWIGMVLVDPNFRRMGIGNMLLRAALESLKDVPSVLLDATPEGRKLYETLGFEDESPLQRWVCPAVPALPPEYSEDVKRLAPEDLKAIVALDAQCLGAPRETLLQSLLENSPHAAYGLSRDGGVLGFCLGRAGTKFHHIGPLVAPNFEDARALLQAVLRERNGQAVLLDVPDAQVELVAWLQTLGFTAQRPLIRMRRGERNADTRTQQLFAICGPEFG